MVNALKDTYKIRELLNIINLKKSTYFYEIKAIKYDKYENIRKIIKEIFIDNYECYGYRRIKHELKNSYETNISEKVVLRLMKQEGLKYMYQNRMLNILLIKVKYLRKSKT